MLGDSDKSENSENSPEKASVELLVKQKISRRNKKSTANNKKLVSKFTAVDLNNDDQFPEKLNILEKIAEPNFDENLPLDSVNVYSVKALEPNGCIDRFYNHGCTGWYYSGDNSVYNTIVAKLGNVLIGSSQTAIFREDVRIAGFGTGLAGFKIDFRFPVHEKFLDIIEIYAVDDRTGKMVFHLKSAADFSQVQSDFENHIKKVDGIIDYDYYSEQYPEIDESECAVHYTCFGRFEGQKPNQIFEPDFYVKFSEAYYRREVALEEALVDYLDVGQRLGARPHPLFDPDFVSENNENISIDAALQEYLLHPEKDQISTSRLIWNKWYAKRYDVKKDILSHFINTGILKGFSPNPHFDLNKLASSIGSNNQNLMSEYVIKESKENISTHILIDAEYINSQIEDKNLRNNILTTLEHYIKFHNEINPHILFDNAVYLTCRDASDISETLLSDYLDQPAPGLRTHSLFWDEPYVAWRPDVAAANCAPLEHYVRSGNREQVITHPLLDHSAIAKHVTPALGETVLEAYLKKFLSENISPYHDSPIDSNVIKRINKCALKIDAGQDLIKIDDQVGLFAHVFYTDLLADIAQVANNMPAHAKVFISTNTKAKYKEIVHEFPRLSDRALEVRISENRGRDIAPFLIGFADRIREVRYGLHIHTKKSPHYGKVFEKWRKYLFHELAGSREIVSGHIRALMSPEIGMSAPVDFAPLEPLLNWGGNRERAGNLISAMGGRLSEKMPLELPSGSMFWFDSAALAPLLDLNMSLAHFDPEAGQVDGTLAHVIERSFFHICELSGHSFVRTTTANYAEGYALTSSAMDAASRRLPSAWRRHNVLHDYHPEARNFVACKTAGAPRLNLLIPTADTSVGYAGVSEAIRLFVGALSALGEGWSGRIIMTDVPPSNMFIPPNGFRLVESFEESEATKYSVVNGCDKLGEFLTLRQKDFFVASAWWNASQAFDLINQANKIFGTDGIHRKLVYLVQDDERGFNAWSTKFKLCDDTYNHLDRTIAVFNTPILAEHFANHRISDGSIVYKPPINHDLMPSDILPYAARDKTVLLYARPHAARNSIDFLDAIVDECYHSDYSYWKDWRWIAIGEDFDKSALKSARRIDVRGRMSLEDYKLLLANARLGISLMISPHPSYPPLEMAAHGMRVVANSYERRDPAAVHSGITSFSEFDPVSVARLLKSVASQSDDLITEPLVDWFFDGKTNVGDVFNNIAASIHRCIEMD
ncbi:rhamnan synthesis F family protein [Sphingobium limneticum]|uniref:Glycosyltransferase n=1 Tax=Sphingobium limneticum TaxID=1007511 RepID=A0A5J5I9D5_9SPHN|nr:rhamnan synthesis F family protein [Sphingobium limneticum]KAA9020753.1 hypothetical protein F4U96_03555 [Sphingobium limneticum]KAA9033079.1 hypothetical protein F4U95_03555 [Sphingobium limneticum]